MSSPIQINDHSVSLGIVIPCFNEDPNIGSTLKNVTDAASRLSIDYQILVVDDHSTDRTVECVRAFAKENPALPVACISNRQNEGLGYNYFLGAELIDCEYYMMINGDNVEPVHDIVAILGKMGAADIIAPYWENLARRGWKRYWPSVTYTWLVNTLSGNRLRYYNGPVLHMRRNVTDYYRFSSTRGFGYQTEIICRALSRGATCLQIEIKGDICHTRSTHAFRMKNVLAVGRTLISVAAPGLLRHAPFAFDPGRFVVHTLK